MKRVAPTAFLIFTLAATSAAAALGEKHVATDTTRAAVSGTHRGALTRNSYTVYETKTDAGVVREFVTSDAVVFAVAWSGVSHPDLTELLGSYFERYKKAARGPDRRRAARSMRQKTLGNDVVVERQGHMRALSGRAYAPSLVPEGVELNEIN